jgi:hydrogenase maturation factor
LQSGHVTQKVSAEEAAETWALYDEMLAAEAARDGRSLP